MKEDLVITIKKGKDETKITRIIIEGRINTSNASAFEHKLKNVIDDGTTNILVNMSRVQYLSSSGIRVILKTYKQLEEINGKFNIEFPSESVKNVLGLAALDKMLIK